MFDTIEAPRVTATVDRDARRRMLVRLVVLAALGCACWLVGLVFGTSAARAETPRAASALSKNHVAATTDSTTTPRVGGLVSGLLDQTVKPVVKPVVTPLVTSVVRPVVGTVVKPVVKPVVRPIVTSVVRPVVKPLADTVVKPVVDTVVKPLVRTVVKSVVRPVVDTVVKPVVKPIVTSVVRPVVDSATKPVVKTVARTVVTAPVAHAARVSIAEPAAGSQRTADDQAVSRDTAPVHTAFQAIINAHAVTAVWAQGDTPQAPARPDRGVDPSGIAGGGAGSAGTSVSGGANAVALATGCGAPGAHRASVPVGPGSDTEPASLAQPTSSSPD